MVFPTSSGQLALWSFQACLALWGLRDRDFRICYASDSVIVRPFSSEGQVVQNFVHHTVGLSPFRKQLRREEDSRKQAARRVLNCWNLALFPHACFSRALLPVEVNFRLICSRPGVAATPHDERMLGVRRPPVLSGMFILSSFSNRSDGWRSRPSQRVAKLLGKNKDLYSILEVDGTGHLTINDFFDRIMSETFDKNELKMQRTPCQFLLRSLAGAGASSGP